MEILTKGAESGNLGSGTGCSPAPEPWGQEEDEVKMRRAALTKDRRACPREAHESRSGRADKRKKKEQQERCRH